MGARDADGAPVRPPDEPGHDGPALGRTGRLPSLTVPTPWYPTPFDRMGGSFVAEYARLVGRLADEVRVVHAQEWPGGRPGDAELPARRRAFDAALDRFAAGPDGRRGGRSDGRRAAGLTVSGAAGPVARVPVFTVGGDGIPARAEAMVRDVRRAIGSFDSPVVHGHVGYWGGLLAARLADPAADVFATEHSTGLRAVLDDPAGRDHYAEVLARARRVFCVSGLLRDQILAVLPEHADTVEVLPNPVEFAGVPRRDRPERLDRWVFVGGLIERKGVERLVRAFTTVARERPEVTLTMFGEGALRDRVVALALDAGVGDRLDLRGVVRHGQILAELPSFDVLFAPSTYETFHLAVVEAVAAGLPVLVTRSGGPQEALAGVESRVGLFVDVEDSPDTLVDAYRALSASLGDLDLVGAAAELDARYGPDAVAARLAAAYGVDPASPVSPPPPGPPRPSGPAPGGAAGDPERVVIVAATAWRRYSVEQEVAGARRLGVPTVVVTADPQVTAWSAGLVAVRPSAVGDLLDDRDNRDNQYDRDDLMGDRRSDGAPTGDRSAIRCRRATVNRRTISDLAVRARRVAGSAKRALAGRPVAVPPQAARLSPADVHGATIVATDCASLPLAVRLADADPTARLVVELDRGGRLGPPPDCRDEVP